MVKNYFFQAMPYSSSAILMPNWIGDLILAISVAMRKREAEGNAPTLIVPERLAPLAKVLCDLPVVPYRRKRFDGFVASARLIRERSFSRLYVLPHSFSSALFGMLTRVPQRRGITAELRGVLLTERLPIGMASRDRHLTHEYSEVLEAPYADPASWDGIVIPRSEPHAGMVVLCPGAAYGSAKQWPRFGELISLMGSKRFVILGDNRDREAGDKIAASAPDRVNNLAGQTTLEQAAAIIAAADLVIANDSGLLHCAGFLGTPCVGIYGSSSSVWTRPLGKKVRIARGGCPRSPCYRRTCPEKHYHCLENIGAETVAELAEDVVN